MLLNEDREFQKAMSKYSASFMSDAKWLKLFRTIIQAEIQIDRAEWAPRRFVWNPTFTIAARKGDRWAVVVEER